MCQALGYTLCIASECIIHNYPEDRQFHTIIPRLSGRPKIKHPAGGGPGNHLIPESGFVSSSFFFNPNAIAPF
jgi:hypothetical protein